MATEHEMFRRFMVESVTYWASEYHLDGFRFDLMGLIDVETMRRIRASLDALPNGRSILMYGEPWAAGQSAPLPGTVLADKQALPRLDSRIGHFCDTTRSRTVRRCSMPWTPIGMPWRVKARRGRSSNMFPRMTT